MAEILKSDIEEAATSKHAFMQVAGQISISIETVVNMTNLSVIGNLTNALSNLMACNSSYKDVLGIHAESIYAAGEEFCSFDSKIAESMGVEYGANTNT